MKKILVLFTFLVLSTICTAQFINGVVNSYAAVNAISNNVVTVNSTAGFNLNDKVMLIKMKGASVVTTNNANYGDTISTGEAGKYIVSKVVALTNNTLTLSNYCSSFSNTDFMQVVSIPQFGNVTVNGTIVCPPWNGITGGIITFEVNGILNLNDNISADQSGFRGGDVLGSGSQCGDTNYFSPLVAFGANGKKGEGIADHILLQQCGRGKLANGGGGAHASNSGAGGGANIGFGGKGSNETDTCGTTGNKSQGGQALAILPHRLFFGGGGGAPQNDQNQLVPNGGAGGGIVFIKANEIVGNGFEISARGETVAITNDEGAPGAGAGGTIILDCLDYSSFLFVDAGGGEGGSVSNIISPQFCQGPGGGGGGGLIHFSTPVIPPNTFINEQGGFAGQILNPNTPCFGTTYGAEDGNKGAMMLNYTPLPDFISPLTVSLGSDTVICSGTSFTRTTTDTFATYTWSNQTTNTNLTITNPGTYFVTVFDNGCTGSDTLLVSPDTSLIPSFNYTLKFGCDFDTLIITNTTIGATQYEWNFNDPFSINNISFDLNPTHIFSHQGVYNVVLVAKDLPCVETINVPISVQHPLDAKLSILNKVCLGDSVLAEGQFLSTPFTNLTYFYDWGDGTSTFAPTGNKWHTFTADGTYQVKLTITDTLGCQDSDIVAVFVAPKNFAYFTTSSDTICVGQAISFKDSMPSTTQRFTWDFGDFNSLTDVHNPTHPFDAPKVYQVALTASEIFTFPNQPICPSYTYVKDIAVLDFPRINLGKDTSICPDLTKSIALTNSIENKVYTWSTGEVANAILVTKPGHYWASESNGYCASSDSIWVKENCYISIPNSFSPNGDGLNEYFIPRDMIEQGITGFELEIYNRWGERIFHTTRLTGNGWDGKYNEKLQPMGVYVYKIGVSYNNGKVRYYQGNVTLVR